MGGNGNGQPHVPYARYRCIQGNPLQCPLAGSDPEDRQCPTCRFPAPLQEGSEWQGKRGQYRIVRCCGARGHARLYEAVETIVGETVALKEYVLPDIYYNAAEARLRQDSFANVSGLVLADGRKPDLRLLVPNDAIVDRPLPARKSDRGYRCYAISDGLNLSPTLATKLAEGRGLTIPQVRLMLQQVLQTLEYLHEQKFRLPSGQVERSMTCGNLSLETLLWVERQEQTTLPEQPFVYIGDLAIWEELFAPPESEAQEKSVAQDLKALGQAAYTLLRWIPRQLPEPIATEEEMPESLPGEVLEKVADDVLSRAPKRGEIGEEEMESEAGEGGALETQSVPEPEPEPLLEEESLWAATPLSLRRFIERLLEFGEPFASAAEARAQLPPQAAVEPVVASEGRGGAGDRRPRWLFWLLLAGIGLLGVGVLAWLSWFVAAWLRTNRSVPEAPTPLVDRWQDVGGVPAGDFRYTAIEGGVWDGVRLAAAREGEDLEQQLRAAQAELDLEFVPSPDWPEAIARVESGDLDFAVVPLVADLPLTLTSRPIAYDGIAVLVAFSTSQRPNSLPASLDGRLSFDRLRRLYGGRVSNWDDVGGPNLPVRLYRPESAETAFAFQQLALEGELLLTFDRDRVLMPYDLMRRILRDFEGSPQAGGLGFLPFSAAFNQCSVYPLALGEERSNAVQALVMSNGRPVRPRTDLCGAKGNYSLPPERLMPDSGSRYPLAYSLGIVYAQDNSLPPIGEKMAELLTTRQGQVLLQQAGLVPLNLEVLEE